MKKAKASVLAVSLIILGIILAISLSVSTVALLDRKSSMGSSKSNQAYQTAESGIEDVLQRIKNQQESDSINTIDTEGSCDGIIIDSLNGYKIELRDSAGAVISDCTGRTVSEIETVKSIGTAPGQAQRAIEVAVAATSANPKLCFVTNGSFFNTFSVSNTWTMEDCRDSAVTNPFGPLSNYAVGCITNSAIDWGATGDSSLPDSATAPASSCGW